MLQKCHTVLSRREFARRVHRSQATISRWVTSGRLSGAALAAGGRKIVVEEALDQLALAIGPDAEAIPIKRLISSEIKLRREALALEDAERRAAVARGRLVNVDDVARRYARELEEVLASIESFGVGLVAALGHHDRASIAIARREFRAWRQRRADQYAAA